MSPRFPQELFDYIIDYAQDDEETLKIYSVVCKSWSIRSQTHLFERQQFCTLRDLEQWCENIPPTKDGPSKYVKYIHLQTGFPPLVPEPPSSLSLVHFSALTRVDYLFLFGHRGKLNFDLFAQCCSGFKYSLLLLELSCNSFDFEEIARMVEFFPKLELLVVWGPSSERSGHTGPYQPPRQISFPHLKGLNFDLQGPTPELDNHILSGFAKASMNLVDISFVGTAIDLALAQELLNSSAHSLISLEVSPLELDLSACHNIQVLQLQELLLRYALCSFHDSDNKDRFGEMLRTINSPVLQVITVVVGMLTIDEDEDEELPNHDWTDVDAWLCDLLSRMRVQYPSWTVCMRITECLMEDETTPWGVILPEFLPDFRALGGVVKFEGDVAAPTFFRRFGWC